jgi:beta-glucosidase
MLAGLGLTYHRLSIDWARVEPWQGVHDQRAVAHYRDILTAAWDAGLVPWVCLHHFTLRRWFARAVASCLHTIGARPGLATPNSSPIPSAMWRGWQTRQRTELLRTRRLPGWGRPPGHNDPEQWANAAEAIHLATTEAAVRLKASGALAASHSRTVH